MKTILLPITQITLLLISTIWHLIKKIHYFCVGIEICERLSTMGIGVNLVTYLVGTMHLPSSTSANIVTDFVGTSFLLCLLGGFLADSFLGRYNTIAIFASIQTLVCFLDYVHFIIGACTCIFFFRMKRFFNPP